MSILLLISFLWAYLEGKREAQYFHYKWSLPDPTKIKDEHFDFTLQRSLYVLLSAVVSYLLFGLLSSILTFFCIALVFSYLHNGSYYLRRNQLNENIYKLKWLDESTTTTAKFSFSYKKRKILFIIGLIISLLFDISLLVYN